MLPFFSLEMVCLLCEWLEALWIGVIERKLGGLSRSLNVESLMIGLGEGLLGGRNGHKILFFSFEGP
jgi:hypothetical protein